MASGFSFPGTIEEYIERVDHAINVARGRIETECADCFDFFYLGGALGFKGRFELMRGKWLSSFFLASEAVQSLKACDQMDENNRDILLGLGAFDYYTAHLSGVLKFLSYFLIHRGNKDEGLRKLHLAARKAVYSSTEAKSFLLHIYLFLEKDFSKALALAEELESRYDNNPVFKLFRGVSYIRLDIHTRYKDMVSRLRQRSMQPPSSEEASLWHKRALYLESVYGLFHGKYPEARLKLRDILNHPDPERDPAMIAWPLIKIGMSYDLEGNREKAMDHYRRILSMENGSGAQFLAKKYLDKPPKKRSLSWLLNRC